MNFGDVGTICLNREIEAVCQNCLWWEWDTRLQRCSNWQYPICHLYREQLLSAGGEICLRHEPAVKAKLTPAGAGSEGPLGVKAGESGNG